jgi:hypothetical protein
MPKTSQMQCHFRKQQQLGRLAPRKQWNELSSIATADDGAADQTAAAAQATAAPHKRRREGHQACRVCKGAPDRHYRGLCHTCWKRKRRPNEVIRSMAGAVWRPHLVEAMMVAQPPDFWSSRAWGHGKGKRKGETSRADGVNALLGADCFEQGGVAGPAPLSAGTLPRSNILKMLSACLRSA